MSLNDKEKAILRNNIIIKYQKYLKKFINENKITIINNVLGEIQNQYGFKNELLLIKDVIINKFENQKYLGEIQIML